MRDYCHLNERFKNLARLLKKAVELAYRESVSSVHMVLGQYEPIPLATREA